MVALGPLPGIGSQVARGRQGQDAVVANSLLALRIPVQNAAALAQIMLQVAGLVQVAALPGICFMAWTWFLAGSST